MDDKVQEYYRRLTDSRSYSGGMATYSFDSYGAAYSLDGKVLINASNIVGDTYAVNEGTEIIIGGAFNGSSLRHIHIPEGVRAIGSCAFSNMENLTEITLPNSLIYIGPYAFSSCVQLEHIDLPNSLRVLDGTFVDCPSLEQVVIPEGVEEVRNRAFNGCGVRQVELPSTIRVLDGAFVDCPSLERVVIPEGVEEIRNQVFSGCGVRQVELPSTIRVLDDAFFPCKSLEVVQWKKLQSEDVVIKSHTFGFCDNLRQIELPDGIKEIEAGAFKHCIYNHRTTKTNQKYPSVNL